MHVFGDPKITPLEDGSFFLSAIFSRPIEMRRTLGGVLLTGSSAGDLGTNIFQDTATLPPSELFAIDYPKLAIDPNSPLNVYITSFLAWFEDTRSYGDALYIYLMTAEKNFIRRRFLDPPIGSIQSMTVGIDGNLYAALQARNRGQPDKILRFYSFDPVLYNVLKTHAVPTSWPIARISTRSNRAWFVYRGPEIITDANPMSPHYGRLYQIWAQAERNVIDPAFENGQYGFNFDVLISYSDDSGDNWSAPVRVNDDNGAGDQLFPSGQIDSNGGLHIAFLDHRNNPDSPVFDVYYAYSQDGVNFSENLKVNDLSVSNPSGGRSVGDYLDMVKAYPDMAFISFPCGQGPSGPTTACMAEVVPINPK